MPELPENKRGGGRSKRFGGGYRISNKDDGDMGEERQEGDCEEGVQERDRVGSPSILISVYDQ